MKMEKEIRPGWYQGKLRGLTQVELEIEIFPFPIYKK